MANRLKPILICIIFEEHFGYVEGRQILDNVLLAQEMIHTLQAQEKASMIIQLDLSKAYDKVSWDFIEDILTAFGFDQCWIQWILSLVRTPSYSILFNGAPSFPFTPSRGIRQGDPISPFIFVIVMECLSRIIKISSIKSQLTLS